MDVILNFLQGHGLAFLLLCFTVASIVVGAAAEVFKALGKQAPGWLGQVASFISGALHFLNGNAGPAVAAVKAQDLK